MTQVQVVLAFYEYLGERTNVYAELYAVWRGLELAGDLGYTKIWIEVDASAVIAMIHSSTRGHWQHQHIMLRIRTLLKRIDYKLTHIYREGNGPADFLADEACRMRRSWILNSDQRLFE